MTGAPLSSGSEGRTRDSVRPPFCKSLSFRLTVIYAVLLSIVLVGFYIILSQMQRRDALHRIDDELVRDFSFVHKTASEGSAAGAQVLMQVVDPAGVVVSSSESLRGRRIPIDLEAVRSLCAGGEPGPIWRTQRPDWHDHDVRVAYFPVRLGDGGRLAAMLASPLDTVDQTAGRFLIALLITFPIIIAVTIMSGLSIAKKALHPIGEITRAARMISADNLSDRLTVSEAGDELDQLCETFNEMISRLEASFEQIRRFTADVSHELRTPLTAIRGETETTLRCARTPREYQQVLASTLEEIERLSAIVSDLLVLSRSAQRTDLAIQTIRLDELVGEVCSHMRILAEDRGLELKLDEMPPLSMAGDRLRLMQLVGNLVDNAIKYTPTGGMVSVALEAGGGRAIVSVSDTGIGISTEDLPHIFERFYRADRSRTRAAPDGTTGTGLGLSICRWIVLAHGGAIDVESRPGGGTTFRVTLPAGEDNEPGRSGPHRRTGA